MKKKYYLNKDLFVEFELSVKQLFIIILLFFVMFAGPVMFYSFAVSQTSNPSTVVVTETYTQSVLEGRVAGESTENTSNYVKIPIINFNFDTTFQDPSSIPFVIGSFISFLRLLLFVFVLVDTVLRF